MNLHEVCCHLHLEYEMSLMVACSQELTFHHLDDVTLYFNFPPLRSLGNTHCVGSHLQLKYVRECAESKQLRTRGHFRKIRVTIPFWGEKERRKKKRLQKHRDGETVQVLHGCGSCNLVNC